jgi:hypothetical protein
LATKHYGVHRVNVILGLPGAAIAARAGWSERAVTKMIGRYAHAVDERRPDEIDADFLGQAAEADRVRLGRGDGRTLA